MVGVGGGVERMGRALQRREVVSGGAGGGRGKGMMGLVGRGLGWGGGLVIVGGGWGGVFGG